MMCLARLRYCKALQWVFTAVRVTITSTLIFSAALSSAIASSTEDKQNTSDIDNSLYALSLEELVNIQVSSPTLTLQKLMSAPASVTVFSRQQIINMGADYLHELINFVPGFQAYRQGESSMEYFHSARGHRTSVSSREVLILVDGVRLNREFDNALAVPMLSLHNVDKVEFIRGPGSAIYGSNAFLGVIDITTVKSANEASINVGELGSRTANAIAHTNVGNWALNIAGNYFTDDGEAFELENYFTLAKERGRDPRTGHDLHLSIENENTSLRANSYQREAESFYASEFTSEAINLVEHKHSNFGLRHKVRWLDDGYTELGFSYSRNSYKPESVFGPLGNAKAEQQEENSEITVHNSWDYSNQGSLQFGAAFRNADISAFEFQSDNYQGEFYPDTDREIFGAYIQSQRKFNTNTELVIGLRYDDYNNVGSSLSPRLGIVHTLDTNQTIKLLYGQAFRAPTINELYLDTLPGDVKGNPDLDPETIKTWELIWFGQWQRFNISINAYYNVIQDAIVRVEEPGDPTFINLASDESNYGAELDLAFQINNDWLIKANASKFFNLPDSDFREAEILASLLINYQHLRWNFSLSGAYSGERDMQVDNRLVSSTAYRISLDDYWLLNSRIQFAANNRLNIFFTARNLLNEEYQTPTARTGHSAAVPNRGSELSLGFTMYFY